MSPVRRKYLAYLCVQPGGVFHPSRVTLFASPPFDSKYNLAYIIHTYALLCPLFRGKFFVRGFRPTFCQRMGPSALVAPLRTRSTIDNNIKVTLFDQFVFLGDGPP